MTYQLGIDLGTAYTAAAVHRDGRAEVVTLGDRAASVPSAIFLKDDDTILTGDAASRRALSEPDRIAREFKRRVGDPTPILLAGTPYSAEALMSKLLRWVVDKVTELQGEAPEQVTVSHPANWGPYKKDLLDQAIRMADIEHATTVTEPEAAAIYYASNARVEPGSVIAVYDLGGGTFDAAVLRKSDGGEWAILGQPEGIERLGGIDFDQAVFAHVRTALEGKIEALDLDDRVAMSAVARLRDDCVTAKEALSSDTDTTIPVLLPNVSTEVRINRGELESLIRPTLQDTIGALRRALRSAGVEPDEVTAVLLVGGSSRIPLVAQLVGAELGRPVAVDAHPKHSIALGAALTAAGAEDPVVVIAPDEVEGEIAAAPAVAAPPPPPPVPPAAAKKRRVPAIALAVLLVAAGAGAWFLLGGSGDDDDHGGAKTTTTLEATTSATSDPPVALVEDISRQSRDTGERYVVTLKAVDFTPVDGGAQTVGEYEVHLFWNTITAENAFGRGGDTQQRFLVWPHPSADGKVDNVFFSVAGRPADATSICSVLATSLDGVPDFDDDGTPDHHVSCAPLPEGGTAATTLTSTPNVSTLVVVDDIRADDANEHWVITWTQKTDEITGKSRHLHFYWATADVPPARATANSPDPLVWSEFGAPEGSIKGTVDANGHGSSLDDAFAISAKPDDADRICIVVVNEDHTMVDEDGDGKVDAFSCKPLPIS